MKPKVTLIRIGDRRDSGSGPESRVASEEELLLFKNRVLRNRTERTEETSQHSVRSILRPNEYNEYNESPIWNPQSQSQPGINPSHLVYEGGSTMRAKICYFPLWHL